MDFPDEKTTPESAGRYYEGRKVFGGRFVLKRKLGQGGMGQVWLGVDTELAGCDVALKFTAPELAGDTKALADLRRAVTLGRELTHPKIIRIHDLHTDAREAAISMEYMPGKNLSEWQTDTPNGFFEVDEIRVMLAQVCEVLDYAHQVARRNHRDIKPKNIMLDAATGTVKLADFDIGRRLTDTFSRNTGKEPSGSLPYMGPQQLLGQNSLEKDDIYSLGATIYELLTSTPPFYMGDLREQIKQVIPGSMAQRRRDLLADRSVPGLGEPIPREWEEVVAACLSKDRDQRPASGAEVMARLAATAPVAAPLPAVAAPVVVAPRASPPPRVPALAVAAVPAAASRTGPPPLPMAAVDSIIARIRSLPVARVIAACAVLGLLSCGMITWMVVKVLRKPDERTVTVRHDDAPPRTSANPATQEVPDGGHKDPSVAGNDSGKRPPADRGESAKPPLTDRGGTDKPPLIDPEDKPPVRPPAVKDLAELGVEEWLPLAEGGDAFAQALMARACSGGVYGAKLDVEQARAWARKSAARNHPLGLYLTGTLSEDDPELAGSNRRKIANEYYVKSVSAGFFIKAEAGGKQWIERTAYAYMMGHGVARDERKAVKLFMQAAEMNDPGAMNNLGVCHMNGTGMAKDPKMAVKWYRKAAEMNLPLAMNNLGSCYDNGVGVAKDPVEALNWYRKAAALNEPVAMRFVGWCYERGSGVRKNLKTAAEWYRKAAERNEPFAMTVLGVCYENGTGVDKDEKKAADWYRKAVELENPIAMRALGLCYLRGAGVLKDTPEAARLFRRGTELNDPVCMTNLGYCFETGAGVTRDHNEALRWYRKAAANGESMAMYNLGSWYEHGTGMSLADDVQKAVEWYRKAAALGNDRAKNALIRLGK
jgi:TPR repeat protein/serine/threonine protein kinase